MLGCVAALIGATPAQGTYPGADGRIGYLSFSTPSAVFTVLPDGSAPQQLTSDPTSDLSLSWSPNGRRLAYSRYGRTHFSMWTVKANGTDLSRVGKRSGWQPRFSPNGHRLIYSNQGTIMTVRLDGTRPRLLRRGVHFESPEYSPDGRRIVMSGWPNTNVRPGLWVMRSDGSGLRRLSSYGGDTFPDYSPDGRHIVFQREPDAHCCNQLLVMRADGSHRREISGFGGYEDPFSPVFSPSGKRIALRITKGDYTLSLCSDIYTIGLGGGNRQRVTFGCNANATGQSSIFPSWQPLPH